MEGNYLDFGSDSDSDDERVEMDSDTEEKLENEELLKMMNMSANKKSLDIVDFEVEMEAELDKRALEIESMGGVQHQKPLSRSSSTSSLNKLKTSSQSQSPKPDSDKSSTEGQKKTVRFSEEPSQSTSNKKEPEPSSSQTASGETDKKFYDDIYFDSDDSDGESKEKCDAKSKKRAFKSDEELFYDPQADDKDEAWVNKQRRRYMKKSPLDSSGNSKPGVSKSLPNSDAVLNCPACFTTLCLDCQRHETYSGQYRAMFVLNCSVNKSETLKVPLKGDKGKKRKKGDDTLLALPHLPSNDLFNPVKCKICNTQVAVFDSDEVYHFFNVLTSYS